MTVLQTNPMSRNWQDKAACREHETPDSTFFPGPGVVTSEAALLCGECPVRAECRACSRRMTAGIWGGRNVEEPRSRRPRI